jgi:hypothetical protein
MSATSYWLRTLWSRCRSAVSRKRLDREFDERNASMRLSMVAVTRKETDACEMFR